MGETRLELVVAHLMIARDALRAGAAAADKRQGHPVAGGPTAHIFAHRGHNAGQLMPGHVRQMNIGVVPHPAVPVAAAQTGRHHLQDHTIWIRGRVRYLLNGEGLLKLFKDGCTHGYTSMG